MSLLGAAVIGGLGSLIGGSSRNKAAAAQSAAQMAFQERMSNTAHQREVEDLRKAGLNPILSGTGGRGASSPTGAQAPMQDIATPAINTAMTARQNIANVKLTNAQECGTGYKADLDAPKAYAARLLMKGINAGAESIKTRKLAMPTPNTAIAMADEAPAKSRTGYQGKTGGFKRTEHRYKRSGSR